MGLDEFLKRQSIEFVLNLELAPRHRWYQVIHKERINTTSRPFPFDFYSCANLPLLTPCTLQHHGGVDHSRQSLVRNLVPQMGVRFEE